MVRRALPGRVLHPTLAVLLAGVALGGVGGCGRSGVPAGTWAATVCQALRPWQEQIGQLNAQAGHEMSAARTPRQTRDNLLRLFAGARDASESARSKIAAAGVPSVSGGKAVSERFVASLAAVRDAYAKAHNAVNSLPLNRSKAFYDAVAGAVATLDREYAQAGPDAARLAPAQLREQFATTPACTGH